MIPELDRRDGGWVVVRRSDDAPIMELFRDSQIVGKINFDKYKLVPVSQYLGQLNKQILIEQGCYDKQKFGQCAFCQ